MDQYDINAALEADYAIERASNPALRALAVLLNDEQTVKQVWEQGYLKGVIHAINRCEQLRKEAFDA